MAIMTGGATGIGEAIAEWLSHAGATVPIVDQNQRETEALQRFRFCCLQNAGCQVAFSLRKSHLARCQRCQQVNRKRSSCETGDGGICSTR
ncbi:MAG: SDR family NAD(P)-dependent oxidoreductase [Acidobacteriota bacterium]